MTDEEFEAVLNTMGVTRETSTVHLNSYEYTWRGEWIGWAVKDALDKVSAEELLRLIRYQIHNKKDAHL